MNIDPALYTLLGTAISVIVAGVVAIITATSTAKITASLALANGRIAVLEQVLKDHGIDVPPLPPTPT